MEDLLRKQNALQNEAKEVIKKLNLMQVLSKYGEAHIVGSLSLGLMTWKDIDFSTVGANEEKFWDIAKELLEQPGIIDLSIQDTGKNTLDGLTTGLYIGIRYLYEDIQEPWERIKKKSDAWKIDLWFVEKDKENAIRKTEEIKSQLDEEKRKIILEIKNLVTSNPSYRKTVLSTDIYEDVLEKGIKNIEDFERYLKRQGKTL